MEAGVRSWARRKIKLFERMEGSVRASVGVFVAAWVHFNFFVNLDKEGF